MNSVTTDFLAKFTNLRILHIGKEIYILSEVMKNYPKGLRLKQFTFQNGKIQKDCTGIKLGEQFTFYIRVKDSYFKISGEGKCILYT